MPLPREASYLRDREGREGPINTHTKNHARGNLRQGQVRQMGWTLTCPERGKGFLVNVTCELKSDRSEGGGFQARKTIPVKPQP